MVNTLHPAVGANLEYIEGEYGGPVLTLESVVPLTTSPVRLVDNNPDCLSLNIINLGTSDAYVGLTEGVSPTNGIVLIQSGGSLSLSVRGDQELPARAWWGCTATGTTDLYILRNARYALIFDSAN